MPLNWFKPKPRPRIDDGLWLRLLDDYPFARCVGSARMARLRDACDAFLSAKRFAGADGMRVTDDIGAAIALQACIPVVELGVDWYDNFDQVIVYPSQFLVPRQEVDEAGVVHEETAALAGETIDGGPVVLSWEDATPLAAAQGWNVVIHEFVHKLDLLNGDADGVPPLAQAMVEPWDAAIDAAWRAFRRSVARIERSIPRWIDPETEQADRYYAHLPLDPYAAHDRGEFFAVVSEAFFVDPETVQSHWPDLFALMVQFFGFQPQSIVWPDQSAPPSPVGG